MKGLELELARSRGNLVLELQERHLTFAEHQRKTRSLEASFLRRARSKSMRREIRRRFAGDRVDGAAHHSIPWLRLRALWDAQIALGFSNLADRVFAIQHVVFWCAATGQQTAFAVTLLEDVTPRIRRSRLKPSTKELMLVHIGHLYRRLNVDNDLARRAIADKNKPRPPTHECAR